jgi:hypothetical protein
MGWWKISEKSRKASLDTLLEADKEQRKFSVTSLSKVNSGNLLRKKRTSEISQLCLKTKVNLIMSIIQHIFNHQSTALFNQQHQICDLTALVCVLPVPYPTNCFPSHRFTYSWFLRLFLPCYFSSLVSFSLWLLTFLLSDFLMTYF